MHSSLFIEISSKEVIRGSFVHRQCVIILIEITVSDQPALSYTISFKESFKKHEKTLKIFVILFLSDGIDNFMPFNLGPRNVQVNCICYG